MTYSKNSSAGRIRTEGLWNLHISKGVDDVAFTNALPLNILMKFFGHENIEVPFVVVLIGAIFSDEGGPIVRKILSLLVSSYF